MPATKTSLSLDPHFEAFIRQQIATGAYATASEVVRDALRRLEIEKQKERLLAEALSAGEASGKPVAASKVFARLRKQHGLPRRG